MITQKILRNLLKIFAITVIKVSPENLSYIQSIVSKFLQNIDEKYQEKYLNFFLDEINKYTEIETGKFKKRSLNSLKIISICEEIGSDLHFKDKYLLMFHLIELSKKCLVNEQSYEYIKLISESIGLKNDKLEQLFLGINNFDSLHFKTFIFKNAIVLYFVELEKDLVLIKILEENFSFNHGKIEKGEIILFDTESVLYFDNYPIVIKDLLKNYSGSNEQVRKFKLMDLSYKFKNKYILNPVSIEFFSGELIAVMGRSGSGKSTFLKAIAGYGKNKRISGKILESTNIDSGAAKIVLVDQNPGFIPYYSVYENVITTAKFFDISLNVEEVLNLVGISHKKDSIAVKFFNKPVNLSGGELKRLSIAKALVSNPDILLLDEPMSGLSSADALEMTKLLRMLADSSRVIFCSLHQPDFNVFLAFDKILFIDEGGYCIFYGKPAECFEYFRNQTDNISISTVPEVCKDPSVIFKLVEIKKYSDNQHSHRKFSPVEWYRKFMNNIIKIDKNNSFKTIKTFYKQNFLDTLKNFVKLYFKSDFKNYKRSFALFFTVLSSGILFSVLLSSPKQFYYNDNFPVWIFVMQLTAVFIGMMISVHEGFYIYEYRKFLRRIFKFHNAEAITIFIKYFLISFILSLVLVFPGIFIMKGDFYGMKLFLWIWILMLWGSFAGILISKLSKNLVAAFVLIPLLIMPQIILSGALVRYDKLNLFSNEISSNVPYIADFIPLRWSLEAVTADFYMNNPYGKIVISYESKIKLNNFKINRFYSSDNNTKKMSKVLKSDKFDSALPDSLKKENELLIILRDLEFRKYHNIDQIRKRYSNIGIDRIIRNYETIDNFTVKNFPRIFHKDIEFINNRVFLTGYKRLGNRIVDTFYYNFVIMFFYVLTLFLSIFVLLKTEKI